MQDVKHLTKKKSGFFRGLFSRHRNHRANHSRRLAEPAPVKIRLKVILPILATLLAVWPIHTLLVSTRSGISSVPKADAKTTVKSGADLAHLDHLKSLQVSADSLSLSRVVGDRLRSRLPDGGTITYNLDVEMQDKVSRFLAEKKVPYAVFLALEPKTGRVLGMVSHSSVDPEWQKKAFYQIYPMASLFKIITASAALEQKKVLPETVIAFSGRLASVNPKNWEPRKRRNNEMTLTDAMGKSVNPVFGRLASEVVGKDHLMLEAGRFGFNQSLFPGTSVMQSTAVPPQTDTELKLMGAGLGREVKISPIHAAAMMAAVANRGVMMTPLLAERVSSGTGEVLFTAAPVELRRMLSQESALSLSRMLSTTVNTGTSRRAFHDRRGRPMLAKIKVAAKTGSIDGKNPDGQYSWFAAYAPMDDPQIALVAMVVNQGMWHIKASNVGEKALESFFR